MGGMSTTVINPRVIFVQALEPEDLTEGKLWYNTTDNQTYVSNGSSYNLVADISLTELEQQNLEQSLNILINSTASSSTLNDYDTMFVDIFSDVDGTSDTIDTGNTTSDFSTDHYRNYSVTSGYTDETIFTSSGVNVLVLKETYTDDVAGLSIKSVGVTLKNSDPVRIARGQLKVFFTDATSTNYLMSHTGSTYTAVTADVSEADSIKVIDYVELWVQTNNNTVTAYCKDIIFNILADGVNELVQTNAISIDANPTAHQVYCHNVVSGSGSITYDISFDGGTTFITGQPINTKNTSVHDGSSMILKLNTNGVGSGNHSQVYDYGVMLYN